jgi:Fe-S cluster biosynthesis and repair protein YggX
MSKLLFCQKLQKEADALDFQPYPGETGKKIFETISKEAWQMWLSHQTMLINEYRLNMLDKKARDFLETEMDKFLFTGGSERPEGWIEQGKRI